MKRALVIFAAGLAICLSCGGDADGRGFGGFGGGGFGGGYRGGDFRDSGYRDSNFREGGFGGEYSGTHSFDSYSNGRSYGGTSSYDRSYTGSHGFSYNAQGERGAVSTPFGAAAGGSRDVTATGPDGRSYSSSREGGVAAGPYGRTVGGGERSTTATGAYGSYHGSSSAAFAGGRMSTDFGLAHYSSFNTVATGHSTAYWSHGAMTTQAGYVRTGFGYYNTFRPGWYTSHPGAWAAAGWGAATAWNAATWDALATQFAVPPQPVYYDYGNTIVYQGDTVYQDGQDIGTAAQYSQQATSLADQGQLEPPPPQQQWTPLGVFALVQGTEKSSNNLFQLAISKDGVLRGNYYDGLMDTTTPIYGSLDKKTQRIAWTIGKKNDRVFDSGLYNLTKSEAPVLVHFGATRTVQMLLVRVEQPDGQGAAAK